LFVVAELAQAERDELANKIVKELGRYTQALELYGIASEKLFAQSTAHQAKQRVQAYLDECNTGQIVIRDRLAAELYQDIRAHYPALLQKGISVSELKTQARMHERRLILKSLNPSEREDFRQVEQYLALSKQSQKLWVEVNQNKLSKMPIPRSHFTNMSNTAAVRDKLAFEIHSDLEKYQLALTHYEIGPKELEEPLKPRFIPKLSKEPTAYEQKSIEFAIKRFEKLQQRAHKHAEKEVHQKKSAEVMVARLNKEKPQKPFVATKTVDHKNPPPEKIPTPTVIDYNKPRWDLETILPVLESKAAHFTETILGQPNRALSNATSYRYGKKGSLVVHIQGDKAGLWYDFQSGEGGHLFQLLQKEYGYTFKEALKHAAEYAGIAPQYSEIKRQPIRNQKSPQPNQISFTEEQKKMIAYAKRLEQQSTPIQGTLAEEYLRTHRGITGDLPESFRFNIAVKEPQSQQHLPALLVIAKDKENQTQAVQCIFLDIKTANKANISTPKRTYGPIKGASVLVQQGKKGIAIAEGPETALSIANADKNLTVYATLGVSNMANIPLSSSVKTVTICVDNDGPNAPSDKAVLKAAEILSERGISVHLCKPKEIGDDFNDVHKKQGLEEVALQLKNTTMIKTAQNIDTISNSKNPIHDFKVMLEKQNKIPAPWLKSTPEQKLEWRCLNADLEKLAYIIEQKPELFLQAKKLQIQQEIIRRSINYQQNISLQQSRGGIER